MNTEQAVVLALGKASFEILRKSNPLNLPSKIEKKEKSSIQVAERDFEDVKIKIDRKEKSIPQLCLELDLFYINLQEDKKSFAVISEKVRANIAVINELTGQLSEKIDCAKGELLDDKFTISKRVEDDFAKIKSLCSQTRKEIIKMETLYSGISVCDKKVREIDFKLHTNSNIRKSFLAKVEPELDDFRKDIKETSSVFQTCCKTHKDGYNSAKGAFDKLSSDFRSFKESPTKSF